MAPARGLPAGLNFSSRKATITRTSFLESGAFMQFSKYHALGDDYVVVEAARFADLLTPAAVRRICSWHCGLGADGVLVREPSSAQSRFPLRILNPDGKESEKTSSGLRIFARYLFDQQEVGGESFQVEMPGRTVTCQVREQGRITSAELGQVQFESHEIPVVGPPRQVIREPLLVHGQKVEYTAAYIRSPHCVVPRERISESETRILGPLIETDRRFPNLTNVEFLQVLDRGNLQLEIWARGVGYYPASGAASGAAAAVARRLGLCEARVDVHMPGGQLTIDVSEDFSVRITGEVIKVAEGSLSSEMF
jgi:diaminopimelate epimerase